MRAAFSKALTQLALDDPRVILLTGDHGYALFDEFRAHCPKQYINAGIAEQNMVGMAAGLARGGFRPFVYGLSAFVPVRVLEQIKLDVAHDSLPVVLIGDGAGFVYSHLGTSHQSTEDIACCRAIPNLRILSPADQHEMAACMSLAYQSKGTVYLRMGKSDRGDVHHQNLLPSTIAYPLKLREGSNRGPVFMATGSMAITAMEVAITHWPAASVWSVPCIKPLDKSTIEALVIHCKEVVTFEEHSVFGGLGSAVAEVISYRSPRRLLRLGVEDRFSDKCGSYEYLLHEHGLDIPSIIDKLSAFFKG
jgi:transketolase